MHRQRPARSTSQGGFIGAAVASRYLRFLVQVDCRNYPSWTTKEGKAMIVCPRIYNPTCGTDGVSYGSFCEICAHNLEHGTHVGMKHHGECKDFQKVSKNRSQHVTACPFNLAEVCGTDGVTYDTDCNLCAHNWEHGTHIDIKHDGKCQSDLAEVSLPRGPNGTVLVACPMIYDPLCGKDGKTYASECMLCNHNLQSNRTLTLSHYGEC
uniref:Kazal-like domain-containing protein n=1 Tax=Crocodylus porosus TaxID=8502 RepID=A0A7M4F4D7_CROPO